MYLNPYAGSVENSDYRNNNEPSGSLFSLFFIQRQVAFIRTEDGIVPDVTVPMCLLFLSFLHHCSSALSAAHLLKPASFLYACTATSQVEKIYF